jgi:hypothetical protein
MNDKSKNNLVIYIVLGIFFVGVLLAILFSIVNNKATPTQDTQQTKASDYSTQTYESTKDTIQKDLDQSILEVEADSTVKELDTEADFGVN